MTIPIPYSNEQKELIEDLIEGFNFGFKIVRSQDEFIKACHNPKYKEINLCAGRGWGKDLIVGAYLFQICTQIPNFRVLFVTPFFSQIESFFDQVMEGVNEHTGQYFIPHGTEKYPTFTINTSKKEIKFYKHGTNKLNGSTIICRSADNPEAIRSKRSNLIVLNECAFIPESVINKQVLSCLKKGNNAKIIRISTPNGCNHFHNSFVRGMRDINHEDYNPAMLRDNVISFHRTYKDNFLSSSDIETEYANKSQREIDEEVLARFLRDSAVFRNLGSALYDPQNCADEDKEVYNPKVHDYISTNTFRTPVVKDKKYFAGIDWAKERDFTVLTIIDSDGKVVFVERTQREDYEPLAKKLLSYCVEYNNATIIFDGTGMQAGIFGPMMYKICNENKWDLELFPYRFSNDSKEELISTLSVRIEQEKSWLVNLPVMVNELRNLQVKRTPLGLPKYEAPSGKHDDCVFSLAMANLLFVKRRDSYQDSEPVFVKLF